MHIMNIHEYKYRLHTELSDLLNRVPKVRGEQITAQPSLRCVTYLYYDPNLNCCYEKMQVNK